MPQAKQANKKMGGTHAQDARVKIDKKSLCKGNEKQREFSLILLGSDSLAGEHGNKLQTCLKSLEKKLDRKAEAYGNEKACLTKWKGDLFWF